jgi:predicted transcriptional regulator
VSRRKGHDPVHAFRASAELVAEARRLAESRGESVSDIVRAALERYVKRYGKEDK